MVWEMWCPPRRPVGVAALEGVPERQAGQVGLVLVLVLAVLVLVLAVLVLALLVSVALMECRVV